MNSNLMAFLGGTIALTMIGCGSFVYLEVHRPEGVNTQVYYALGGILGPIFAVMLAGLRSHVQATETAVIAQQAVTTAKETKKDILNAINGGMPFHTDDK